MNKLEETSEVVTQYVLLGFILTLIGFLVYRHTGQGPNQLSPDFWAGAALPILIQLIRKTFDLKKTSEK